MTQEEAKKAYEDWLAKRKGIAKDGTTVSTPLMMMDAAVRPVGLNSASFSPELQDQLDRSQRARDEELSRRWRNCPTIGE